MPKSRNGSRKKNGVLNVGGAQVRLIKARASFGGITKNTAGTRSVLVPSGGRGVETFPAVDRLVQSMRQ